MITDKKQESVFIATTMRMMQNIQGDIKVPLHGASVLVDDLLNHSGEEALISLQKRIDARIRHLETERKTIERFISFMESVEQKIVPGVAVYHKRNPVTVTFVKEVAQIQEMHINLFKIDESLEAPTVPAKLVFGLKPRPSFPDHAMLCVEVFEFDLDGAFKSQGVFRINDKCIDKLINTTSKEEFLDLCFSLFVREIMLE